MKYFKDLKEKIDDILLHVKTTLDILHRVGTLLHKVEKQIEPPELTIARHTLGSIDLKDITDPDGMKEDDYKLHIAGAAQAYSILEKEAKWMIKLQHDFWFTSADGENQMMFGRGTTNGIQLLLDRLELLKNKHIERITPEKEPEIGSTEDILAKVQSSRSDTGGEDGNK